MKEYTTSQIANWFLAKESISPKKLQKLMYYAYAWTLTLTNDSPDELNNRLFNDKFQAWVHGPVLNDIYHQYAQYGYHNIDSKDIEKPNLVSDIEDILEQVWDVYGKYSADELESLTHQESPWKTARAGVDPLESCQNELDDRIIYECYISRIG
ncbi:Panacea domain-containing protein [Latilactobacillus curvatus]|uniref:Panacea domain-containing protein n=1 Tax=Latilactobacillus curvatus TaxID=28038 RepID=UPI003C2F05F2